MYVFNRTTYSRFTQSYYAADFMAACEDYLDALHQESLRKTFYIYNVPEVRDENVYFTVLEFFRDIYGFTMNGYDLDRVYRVGRPPGNRPRALLVTFLHYEAVQLVLRNRYYLQGTMFAICEQLTPKRQELKRRAQEVFGKMNVGVKNGSIYLRRGNNNREYFTTLSELNELIGLYSPGLVSINN